MRCQAILNIISNPVNSTVPIAAEALKKLGVYDKRKVLGVTTLDVVSTLLVRTPRSVGVLAIAKQRCAVCNTHK
jgi:hypothetical protein